MMAAVMMMRAVMKQEMDRFMVFLHLGMCTYNTYTFIRWLKILFLRVGHVGDLVILVHVPGVEVHALRPQPAQVVQEALVLRLCNYPDVDIRY